MFNGDTVQNVISPARKYLSTNDFREIAGLTVRFGDAAEQRHSFGLPGVRDSASVYWFA